MNRKTLITLPQGGNKLTFFLPEHRPPPFADGVAAGGLLTPFVKLKGPVFLMNDNKSFALAALPAPPCFSLTGDDRLRLSFAPPYGSSRKYLTYASTSSGSPPVPRLCPASQWRSTALSPAFAPPHRGPSALQHEAHGGGLHLFVGVDEVNEVASHRDLSPPPPPPQPEQANWPPSLRGWVLALQSCVPLDVIVVHATEAMGRRGNVVWERRGQSE